jgi:transcription initiation factor TFIIE subunit alpha
MAAKNPTATLKTQTDEVIRELVGDEALPIIWYLKGKHHVSEFKIAQDCKIEIHKTRNLLYRLLEHNLVFFHRKKDKIKGWYICYWDFNEKAVPHVQQKIKKNQLEKLEQRLNTEAGNVFYMCRSACVRMSFEKAMDFNFKCPECGELMNEQDNSRTIEFLKGRVTELGKKIIVPGMIIAAHQAPQIIKLMH